jgi:hypothetical protein
MWEMYNGSYTRIDGSEVKGPSMRALMKGTDIKVAQRVVNAMQATNAAMTVLKQTADSGKMAYDQMIGPDNPEGNKIVQNVVDTLVAQHLLKAVAAARLMGAECIISGIRPQIAQTMVHLGVELQEVVTKSTLADAFAVALKRTNRKVVSVAEAARG